MSKITFLALVAIVIGIAGGVIEVKFHPDKLSVLPGNLIRLSQDGTLREKGRQYFVSLKRQVEFWIVQDKEQRLEIAIGYVRTDAKRLTALLEDKQSADQIMPQAELLITSLERAETATEEANATVLTAWQDKTKTAFAEAGVAVERLRATHERYQEVEQQFAALVEKITQQIGTLKTDKKAATVAGAKDEGSPTPTSPAGRPAPTIPAIQLNF